MSEFECGNCDEEFKSEKSKLEHELEEHEEDLSSHSKSEKKNKLNKIKEKEKSSKQERNNKIKLAGGAVLGGLVLAVFGLGVLQLLESTVPTANESIGVGTPVHWHADYRISVCGQERVVSGGPILAHTHGEKTFHLEGVRERKEQATLGWAMDQLSDGEFNSTHVFGQSTCNGDSANLTVSVNGEKLDNPRDKIIRDGDMVVINLE